MGFYVVTGTLLFWCPVTLRSHTGTELTLLGYLNLDMKTLRISCPACFPKVTQCISVWTFTCFGKSCISFPFLLYFILITVDYEVSTEGCASIALAAVLQLLLYWIQRITQPKFCHWFCNWDTKLVRSQSLRSSCSGTQSCKCKWTMRCNRHSCSLLSCPRITFRSSSHQEGITGKMLTAMPMGGW